MPTLAASDATALASALRTESVEGYISVNSAVRPCLGPYAVATFTPAGGVEDPPRLLGIEWERRGGVGVVGEHRRDRTRGGRPVTGQDRLHHPLPVDRVVQRPPDRRGLPVTGFFIGSITSRWSADLWLIPPWRRSVGETVGQRGWEWRAVEVAARHPLRAGVVVGHERHVMVRTAGRGP